MMKRGLILAVLVMVGCAASPVVLPPEASPPIVDAVTLLPEHYHVLFEDDYIRAVENRIPAGASEKMHAHSYPRVLYAVNSSRIRIRNGGDNLLESKPGDTLYRQPDVHRVDNIGPREAVFIMVELKKPQPEGRFVVREDDAAKVAAEVYHLLLENDRVRVFEIRSKPGQKTAIHSHPGLAFRYRMSSTRSRVTLPDGRVIDSESQLGSVVWSEDPSEHAFENIGTTESRTLLVEVK